MSDGVGSPDARDRKQTGGKLKTSINKLRQEKKKEKLVKTE